MPNTQLAILLEAENFNEKGGWVVDQQFMDQMGSPFLLAHGLGRPVADATTEITASCGNYRLWVRTRDWVAPQGPGKFQVIVNGKAVSTEFGIGNGEWNWTDGGEINLADGKNEIRLHDLTGFEGRCDAIFFSNDGSMPPSTWDERKKLLGLPEKAPDAGCFDFVVVGGGYAGMCAAVAAARLGVKTAIIQDRPVFGGNGSSEVRVGPIGELDLPPFPKNSDLMHEINELSKSNGATSGGVRPMPDDSKLDRWMRLEKDLECFVSMRCVSSEKNKDGSIAAVIARHIETGKELRFPARYFCDATGDACLALLSGADVRDTPERKEETEEPLAAAKGETVGGFGSTNYWSARWADKETSFPSCPWAFQMTDDNHEIGKPRFPVESQRPYVAGWNWEAGFDKDAYRDGELIRDINYRAAFGKWDYLKNKSPDRAAYAKAEMDWLGFITGKRAAKRIIGDHILCEQDITEPRIHHDGVVTTTWYLDMHFPHPQNASQFPSSFRSCAYDDPNWKNLGVNNSGKMTQIKPYAIPFRCLYSRNVPNLFSAGKDISCTHVALASIRVENTTGQIGTVVGRAAYLCIRNNWSPRDIAEKHFNDLANVLNNPKREIWLFTAASDMKDAPLVAATVAWLGEAARALVDSYFETYRDGMLFAENGSQVISGRHFQDFNYLASRANLKVIRYGKTTLFDSTIATLGIPVIADASEPRYIYDWIVARNPVIADKVSGYLRATGFAKELKPYLYPEIAFGKKLYLPEGEAESDYLKTVCPLLEGTQCTTLEAAKDETIASLTQRMSAKWKDAAKSVFFGDPAALACRIPAEVRRKSVPLYAPCEYKDQRETVFSSYAECISPLADKAAELASEIGDKVICGRQTGDGDIFHWAKHGCCIQIVDPYRPTFPCIEKLPQRWATDETPANDDPDDSTLREWAKQGKVLTTLLWHSGEIAHNEAMLNVIEYAQMHKFKMGIAVHAQRYETCPQLWELLRVPVSRGGAAELIEPVLHTGGLGVMVEAEFPPEQFVKNIAEAKARIARIAGPANVPTGYYAFMDTDLPTCTTRNETIWNAASNAGMDYFVSSCMPGRPRVLWEDSRMSVINQTFRTVEGSSPYVRLTSAVDLQRGPGVFGPGWRIGVLDAPVVAFTPYIWECGKRFIEITEQLKTGGAGGWYENVKPRVIARYARILNEMGLLGKSI